MTSSVTGSTEVTNPYAVVNGTTSGSSGTGSSIDPNSAQGIQNRFLTLLTAQLKAQDPSNPMDNNQITSQMAQISSVTGMENLNTTMKSVLQSQISSQSLLAATTVGRQALVASDSMQWDGNTTGVPAVAAIALDTAADQMTVTVKNAAGQVMNSYTVDKPQAGMNAFAWDGKDSSGTLQPAGAYSFSAVATAASASGSTQVPATGYANQKILAVGWDSAGAPQLVMSNGKRYSMSDVQQIS
jgi:flagellar basal-body rod modification protein FlgD